MRKRFYNSLFIHLFFIVFLATLPAFFIIYRMSADMKLESIQRDKQSALQLARGLSMGQTIMTTMAHDTMKLLLDAPEVRSLDMSLIRENLMSILDEFHQQPRALLLFDAKANLIGYSGRIPVSGIDKKKILQMLDSKEFVIGLGIDNGPDDVLLLPCYQTIYSNDGEAVGVFCLILDVEKQYNTFVKDLGLSDRWRVVVSDAEGALLYVFPEAQKKGIAGEMHTVFPKELFKDVSAGDAFGNYRAVDNRGEMRLGGFIALRVTPESPTYGYILVGTSETAVVEMANQQWRSVALRFLFFVVLVFAIALSLVRRLFEKPLMRISEAAQQFKKGKLSVRTGITTAQNEIVDLAKAFDDMASTLELQDKERKEAGKQLEKQASTDTLTGIFNRRAGLIVMEQAHAASIRNNAPMSLCFIDLDGFKEVNDTYGHAEGDRVLVFAADLLKKAIRTSDSVCRMGGDEFLLILPECDQESAVQMWDRVQSIIDTANKEALLPLDLKMSHGIVTFDPKQPTTLDALMALADERMYEDKKKRKRMVCTALNSESASENSL